MKKSAMCQECGYPVTKIPKTAAKLLRTERKAKKCRVEFIAKMMHVTRNYVYMLETGQRRLNHQLVHKYKSALAKV